MVGGFFEPVDRLLVVLRHAETLGVGPAELVLGQRVALLGGLAVPLDGLGLVLGDALAIGVHVAEVELGHRIAFPGRRRELLERDRVVGPEIGPKAGLEIGRRLGRQGGKQRQRDQKAFHGLKTPPSGMDHYLVGARVCPWWARNRPRRRAGGDFRLFVAGVRPGACKISADPRRHS